MHEMIEMDAQVPLELGGQRLDQVAAQLFPEYSRSRLQGWIKAGQLLLDDRQVKPREKVVGGEWLRLEAELEVFTEWQAEPVDFPIHYVDEHVIVVNKPAGLTVHPGAGTPNGTLLNGLLHYDPDLAAVPRAGIVHRLDKDTTGLMVVARTVEAHTELVRYLQARDIDREYEAVCKGVMTGGGEVEEPIARHPTQRIKMAVRPGGKPALTHYRVLKRFAHHTHVRLKLESGRTHQIRVHMDHIHYPLVGDPVYGGQFSLPRQCPDLLREALQGFQRQALHAKALGFPHPATGQWMHWEIDLPEDMQALLQVLEEESPADEY
ncbi:MAG: 23S rRNA pseudouridine(1911/1915/1917) synthase RluD [Natronospirillum sp.]|uniref:23S rRNA pseudouridine(1911/1915/1917) synthase RluD n=1 Tax=Natronospirillum sp. TaxID=2812955 RepID=UPI0025ED9F75|nr:23S rRNA pseudouridine(1911/1915/1917) synthase RluD [Natronospirillum sp.]MCH8551141.1 23S rRNA pseudouridine(1911/1915/1917) synthase RluD [Natronospirillum sp.]